MCGHCHPASAAAAAAASSQPANSKPQSAGLGKMRASPYDTSSISGLGANRGGEHRRHGDGGGGGGGGWGIGVQNDK